MDNRPSGPISRNWIQLIKQCQANPDISLDSVDRAKSRSKPLISRKKTKKYIPKDLNPSDNWSPSENRVALDCEMVGVGPGGESSILARVSIVDYDEKVLLDSFVAPTEPITDYRTKFSGVTAEKLVGAPDFHSIQSKVHQILKGKILIGHSLKNDLDVLFLSHPQRMIRDTGKYKPLRLKNRILFPPSLKDLSKRYLNITIQTDEHDSVVDAITTLRIYKLFQKEWDLSMRVFKPK